MSLLIGWCCHRSSRARECCASYPLFHTDPAHNADCLLDECRKGCHCKREPPTPALPVSSYTYPPPSRPRYEVNFEPQSGILNDLYQGYVRTPPGQWSTLALPLNRLLLTGQGQIRDVQRKWDTGMELKSIGFTIADGVGGPFRLDVAWVSLVPEVRVNIGARRGKPLVFIAYDANCTHGMAACMHFLCVSIDLAPPPKKK